MRKVRALGVGLVVFVVVSGLVTWDSRRRSARWMAESVTIGEVREVIQQENMYTLANNGAFDTLACVGTPSRCLPGYPADQRPLLDPSVTDLGTRHGYSRRFVPGRRDPKGLSPSSLKSFAYIAVPVEPGNSGVRGFCGHSNGTRDAVICFTADGSMPPVVDGHCVTTEEDQQSACALLR